MILVRQPRGRAHRQGSTSYDQTIRVPDQFKGVVKRRLREKLSVKRDFRPDHPPAFRTFWNRILTVENEIGSISLPAGNAVTPEGASVDLLHIPAASFLVESVYILGDHSVQFSLLLHQGKLSVRRIRLYVSGIQIPAKIRKEHLRFTPKALIAEQILRTVSRKPLVSFPVQTVLTPKVRDTTLCRYPRTTQKHNTRGRINNCIQTLYLLFLRKDFMQPRRFHAIPPV